MKKLFEVNVKTVVAIGVGTALFVALSYVQIPSPVPNTSIQARVAILAFFSAVFGPIAGGLIGLFGHALADSMQYGGIWWSWVISSAVMGFILGLFVDLYKINIGGFGKKQIIIFNIIQIITNTISWGMVAPFLDVKIYSEPSNKVIAQGIVAASANMVTVGVLATLLAIGYSKTRSKTSSLKRG